MDNEQAQTKTHWLQSPNKNYLGHWDLPDGKDLILTIKSAQWEEVKNPIINTKEAKRVIRFIEDVKPMICNQTNAQSILDCTGEKFMEDCFGKKIKLCVSTIKDRRTKDDVDCMRIRKCTQAELQPQSINEKQLKNIQKLVASSSKSADDICGVFNIDSLSKLPACKYNSIVKRLVELQNDNT